jgi:hypothetical protein
MTTAVTGRDNPRSKKDVLLMQAAIALYGDSLEAVEGLCRIGRIAEALRQYEDEKGVMLTSLLRASTEAHAG